MDGIEVSPVSAYERVRPPGEDAPRSARAFLNPRFGNDGAELSKCSRSYATRPPLPMLVQRSCLSLTCGR
jgi:hypothetical protein